MAKRPKLTASYVDCQSLRKDYCKRTRWMDEFAAKTKRPKAEGRWQEAESSKQ